MIRSTRQYALGVTALVFMGCTVPTERVAPDTSRVLWSVPGDHGGFTVVADSTRVYFTNFSNLTHVLYAVEKATGRVLWSTMSGTRPNLPAAFSFATLAGPVIVIPNGALYGFDRATGALRWQFHPSSTFFGTIAGDSATAYAVAGQDTLFAINAATGAERWRTPMMADTNMSAVGPIVANATVYVGISSHAVHTTGGLAAVNARTGQPIWYTDFPSPGANIPGGCSGGAVVVGNVVVAASHSGQLFGLSRATGEVRWTVRSAPVPPNSLGDDRPLGVFGPLVVAGSTSGSVAAYDALTGAVMWQHKFDGSTLFDFASDDKHVYVDDGGGTLVAMNGSTGAIDWTFGGSQTAAGLLLWGAAADGAAVYIGGTKAGYALRKN